MSCQMKILVYNVLLDQIKITKQLRQKVTYNWYVSSFLEIFMIFCNSETQTTIFYNSASVKFNAIWTLDIINSGFYISFEFILTVRKRKLTVCTLYTYIIYIFMMNWCRWQSKEYKYPRERRHKICTHGSTIFIYRKLDNNARSGRRKRRDINDSHLMERAKQINQLMTVPASHEITIRSKSNIFTGWLVPARKCLKDALILFFTNILCL